MLKPEYEHSFAHDADALTELQEALSFELPVRIRLFLDHTSELLQSMKIGLSKRQYTMTTEAADELVFMSNTIGAQKFAIVVSEISQNLYRSGSELKSVYDRLQFWESVIRAEIEKIRKPH